MATRADFRWLGEWRYAHRGLHGDGCPENSRAAIEAAVARGYGIECDVQASRDGHAMVFHDWTLERLTESVGALRDFDAAGLEPIGLRGGGTLWRLETLLRRVAGRVPVLIEIKSHRTMPSQGLCRSVAKALRHYRGKAAIMSFDRDIVRWFADVVPNRPRGLVTGRREYRESGGVFAFRTARSLAITRSRPDFLACDIRDLPDPFIARQRARGMIALTWTVRTKKQRKLAKRSCDAPIAEGKGIA
ncbi:glycerophosphodiester phosphodiesterase family protein [Croceicoccus hydrothermalis]|uniref:glycerophosphodiester phosphodiesterase family protein n=1 Tax=Croceicoccus hydrothermalis TaxID=2867964 RepID=UPI001EFBE6FF|nr:glycerophosphodiester phosphodiesterase family protein [Croceicoccus hydrothermalis]